MAGLLGKNAVIYYSNTLLTANDVVNTASVDSWFDANNVTEFDNVVDLSDNFTPVTADATTRSTAKSGWEAEQTVLNSGQITFDMHALRGDTVTDAIIDAFLNQTLIAFADMDGTLSNTAGWVANTQGLVANFSVGATLSKPVKGIQTWSVTLTIAEYPFWWKPTSAPLS